MDHLMSILELSKYLGISHITLRRLVTEGEAPAYVVVGKAGAKRTSIRFDPKDVEIWLEKRKSRAPEVSVPEPEAENVPA